MRLTCTPPSSNIPFNKSSARVPRHRKTIASGQQQQSTMAPISPRLFRFGVATDIQYADIPDGRSFAGTPRYYRAALDSARRTVEGWRSSGVEFGLHLGDIVDGFAKDNAGTALEAVLQVFSTINCKTFHLLGNHCLYNLPRAHLNSRLGIEGPPDGSSYYSFCPHPGWRFIMLDSYDISSLGWQAGHPKSAAADDLLARLNPNQEKNSPEGLHGPDRRFVKFNGGVGPDQLSWMEGQCQAAAVCGQRVIVGSHVPIHPESAATITLIWNYEEVLSIIGRHPHVVATIAGHTHRDRYHQDSNGVHHRVLKGVIETEPGLDCFGVVDVHDDAIVLQGYGIESAVMQVPSFDDLMTRQHQSSGNKPAPGAYGDAALDVMRMLPTMKMSVAVANDSDGDQQHGSGSRM